MGATEHDRYHDVDVKGGGAKRMFLRRGTAGWLGGLGIGSDEMQMQCRRGTPLRKQLRWRDALTRFVGGFY
jgi:hypothetical protein